ncbi:hypothetical protein B1H19_37515 [Streptomyces gilvosporeus]|uniref:Cytochrome P450 n=1 Tax=Streptomyces gilvosporeus TaxID=553510 RepID=A0A1V0U1M2_9ACTN|nr:hypothetical protein B1H19_37515 [Streptomyces gilvosporeus]
MLLDGDLPAWLVLGCDEFKQVTSRPLQFTRDSGQWITFRRAGAGRFPAVAGVAAPAECAFVDGAEHARLRGAVTDSLEQFALRGTRCYTVR